MYVSLVFFGNYECAHSFFFKNMLIYFKIVDCVNIYQNRNIVIESFSGQVLKFDFLNRDNKSFIPFGCNSYDCSMHLHNSFFFE